MATWPKENKSDIAIKFVLFWLSPFFAAIYSLKTLNRWSSYVVFFLFAVFFGMAFTVPAGKSTDFKIDGAFYRQDFEHYRKMSQTEFNYLLDMYMTFQGRSLAASKDFLYDYISFYISRITDNYHVMFMVFAMIFAWFSLRSFRFFTKEINFKIGIVVLLLTFFFMFNQIFNINGLRFWTAAWMGVYSVFQLFVNQNKRYLLLLAFIPVLHVSYLFFILIVLIAWLFKRFEKIWIVLFFVSFLFAGVSVELLNSNLDLLPSIIRNKAAGYASAEYIEQRNAGSGFYWVTQLSEFMTRLYIGIMLYLFIKNRQLITENLKTKRIYLFLLVYMTMVNFVMPIPSLGNRFIVLAYPIMAYIWLVNFKNVKYRWFLYLIPFVFWFQIYRVCFILYPQVTDWSFYVSSPFILVYKYLIHVQY